MPRGCLGRCNLFINCGISDKGDFVLVVLGIIKFWHTALAEKKRGEKIKIKKRSQRVIVDVIVKYPY